MHGSYRKWIAPVGASLIISPIEGMKPFVGSPRILSSVTRISTSPLASVTHAAVSSYPSCGAIPSISGACTISGAVAPPAPVTLLSTAGTERPHECTYASRVSRPAYMVSMVRSRTRSPGTGRPDSSRARSVMTGTSTPGHVFGVPASPVYVVTDRPSGLPDAPPALYHDMKPA